MADAARIELNITALFYVDIDDIVWILLFDANFNKICSTIVATAQRKKNEAGSAVINKFYHRKRCDRKENNNKKKVATVAQRSTRSVIFVNGPLLLLCPNNCSTIVSYDLHSFLCLSFSRSHFDHHHHQKRLIYHYHHLQIHILVRLFPFLIFFFCNGQRIAFRTLGTVE